MSSRQLLQLVAAISAVGLPACLGLHMLEEDAGSQAKLVFGVHHKTGTELATHASGCFDSDFNHKEVKMFTCSQLAPNEKAVHFTRNPINLALSAYLYHKTTGEDWTWKRGSAMELLRKDLYSRRHVQGNEAYTQFLRRVSARVGIRAETYRLTSQGGEFDQIVTGEKNCGRTEKCMEICLEDFTTSSSSYDASWRKIATFMGTHVTPKMHSCLTKEDLHRHKVDPSHVTSNVLSEKLYNEMRKMVWEVDNLSFNSRLKKLGQGRLQCGGASALLLRTDSDLNATYGGGYKEWLIEEEYSKTWDL